MRRESLLHGIREGRMLDRATTGRKRLQMLTNVTSKTHEDLEREAADRSGWLNRLSQTCLLRQKTERREKVSLVFDNIFIRL